MEEPPRAKTFVRIMERLFWRAKLTGCDKSARFLSSCPPSTRGPYPKIGANDGESSNRRQMESPVKRAAQAPESLDRCAFEKLAPRRKALQIGGVTMTDQRPGKTRLAATMLFSVFAYLVFGLVTSQPVHAQSAEDFDALKLQIEALRQDQAAIQKDVTAIRKLLEGAPRPAQAGNFKPSDITVTGSPFLGKDSAAVVLA